MEDRALSPLECRIVATLVEKEVTTPNAYPLTLNALVSACNQKSNRSPVTAHTPQEIDEALSLLLVKGWVTNTDQGGRVLKWKHRLRDRLQISEEEAAVLAELMLRGPQQRGELRARAARMRPIADQSALGAILEGLMRREPPLVKRLPRRAGERAERYAETLSAAAPEPFEEPLSPATPLSLPEPEVLERLARLEREVEELRRLLHESLRRDAEDHA